MKTNPALLFAVALTTFLVAFAFLIQTKRPPTEPSGQQASMAGVTPATTVDVKRDMAEANARAKCRAFLDSLCGTEDTLATVKLQANARGRYDLVQECGELQRMIPTVSAAAKARADGTRGAESDTELQALLTSFATKCDHLKTEFQTLAGSHVTIRQPTAKERAKAKTVLEMLGPLQSQFVKAKAEAKSNGLSDTVAGLEELENEMTTLMAIARTRSEGTGPGSDADFDFLVAKFCDKADRIDIQARLEPLGLKVGPVIADELRQRRNPNSQGATAPNPRYEGNAEAKRITVSKPTTAPRRSSAKSAYTREYARHAELGNKLYPSKAEIRELLILDARLAVKEGKMSVREFERWTGEKY